MVRTGRTAVVGLATLALIGAGRAAAQDAAPAQAAQPPEPLTQRHDSFASAIATPAEDLNLKHVQIPDVLQNAAINPYDVRIIDRCDLIAAEMQSLDQALGPDKDIPAPPDARTEDEKRQSDAASVLKVGVETIEPYRGIVRFVTGATAYDRKLQATIEAGFARRGFLKGAAMAHNCAPPASPAWFVPAKPVSRPVYARYAPYGQFAGETASAAPPAPQPAPPTVAASRPASSQSDYRRNDDDPNSYPDDLADPPIYAYPAPYAEIPRRRSGGGY